tara:strand:+ start:974 stop:1834 length:861 start_codon:yes stop_codon:yes gene_type:complete
MPYLRFALMIGTSTLVMFVLMYLNTYALEHIFYSETRVYMAILMGATMAVVMMLWMWGMYPSRPMNLAILAGAVAVFAGSLWLVRSQVTVSGPSYMRAMIPHHSIAIMTSERAGIEDARVARLAHEIAAAQRKEIAEMRYLITETAAGRVVNTVYQDPPAQAGTMADALANTKLSALDPEPLSVQEAQLAISPAGGCRFNETPGTDPILWTSADGLSAAMKVNGVVVVLEPDGAPDQRRWSTDGLSVAVTPGVGGFQSDTMLAFDMDPGPSSGFGGFWHCGTPLPA